MAPRFFKFINFKRLLLFYQESDCVGEVANSDNELLTSSNVDNFEEISGDFLTGRYGIIVKVRNFF